MKFIIATLAIIMMVQVALAQNYVTLSASTVRKSRLIQDLRDLGADFVAQQGVFVSKKSPFLGNFYTISKTEKVERRITANITYYRYTVILVDPQNFTTANATYTINFRPVNASFIVASYSYNILASNPNNTHTVGGPALIDIRPLNAGKGDLYATLNESLHEVVADAIAHKSIPNATYTLSYVYNAYSVSSGYPPQYVFLVKVLSSKGIYYRLQITATEDVEGEDHTNPDYIIYTNK